MSKKTRRRQKKARQKMRQQTQQQQQAPVNPLHTQDMKTQYVEVEPLIDCPKLCDEPEKKDAGYCTIS